MGSSKYDYRDLEAQFLRGVGGGSVRELCRVNGIPEARVSSIHDQARKKDDKGRTWYDKLEELKGRSSEKTIELLSEHEAQRALREAEVRANAIDGIDEAISKMRADMKRTRIVERDGHKVEEPLFIMYPKDLVGLLDRLQTMFGRPLLITEDRHLGLTVHAEPDSIPAIADLSRLAGLARERSRGADIRRVGSSPLPNAPDDRPHKLD